MKNLALFDFDHTITTNDNFTTFIYYSVPKTRLLLGKILLAPFLLAYKLGILPGTRLRQLIVRIGFTGRTIADVNSLATTYAREELPKYIRPNAWERIQWHKSQGDDVVIVSASLDLYLKVWCLQYGFDVICTELEIKNGRCTGRYLSGDCSSEEKARRVRTQYDFQNYSEIYAYGDSKEDEAMLRLAHRQYYRWEERN